MAARIDFVDCNGQILGISVMSNWRASLVPAAAVIPAPIAYITAVAVKMFVVAIHSGTGSCGLFVPQPVSVIWEGQGRRRDASSLLSSHKTSRKWGGSSQAIRSGAARPIQRGTFGAAMRPRHRSCGASTAYRKGMDGDIRIEQQEVKFWDLFKTNKGEGICH